MAEVSETVLPGVGIRHEFTTTSGERVGVLLHRGGGRDLLLYGRHDPDAPQALLHLSDDDSRTLGELLGASRISEAVTDVEQRLEGLAIAWVTVPATSSQAGVSLSDADFRQRTGASVVAVVRADATIPAPPPSFELAAGDVAVAVGTPEGLERLRQLIER